VVDPQPLSELP